MTVVCLAWLWLLGSVDLSASDGGDAASATATTDTRQVYLQQRQHPLPTWIADYVKWHKQMRDKFPGDKVRSMHV